jgi:arabinogalactan oligomer/maltooligosaccharide transport system permease protein
MDSYGYLKDSFFKKVIRKFLKSLVSLPNNFKKLIFKVYSFLKNSTLSFINETKNFFSLFANGNKSTKISYFIMGYGTYVTGQKIKGLLYLFLQVSFLLFLFNFALNYIIKLPSLGLVAMEETIDPISGLILYRVVDNSMLIIIYSVLSFFVILAFISVYLSSVKNSYQNQILRENGKYIKSFKEELKEFLNSKFHITLLSIPTLGVISFTVVPIIFMILLAFTNYDRNHMPPGNLFQWVGLINFETLFSSGTSQSNTFRELLNWTVIWATASTFLNYILGMILAIVINKKDLKLKKFWRTIFILTIAIPQFVSLLIVSQLLGELGLINNLLIESEIISAPIKFLTNGTLARWVVIVVNLWVGIPYSMLITTGILMNIPSDLYEAAKIDGASPFMSFIKVTLPYMLFVTGPYLITQYIGNVNNFNVIYLLTGGGPASSDLLYAGRTDLLVTWLYKLTVDQQNYSLASTIGIIVFVISAGLSLIAFNLTASAKKEEDFQ